MGEERKKLDLKLGFELGSPGVHHVGALARTAMAPYSMRDFQKIELHGYCFPVQCFIPLCVFLGACLLAVCGRCSKLRSRFMESHTQR